MTRRVFWASQTPFQTAREDRHGRKDDDRGNGGRVWRDPRFETDGQWDETKFQAELTAMREAAE